MILELATKHDIDEYLSYLLDKASTSKYIDRKDVFQELYDMLFVSIGPNGEQKLQEVIKEKFPKFKFETNDNNTYEEDCTKFIQAFHEYVEKSENPVFPTFEDWYETNKAEKRDF